MMTGKRYLLVKGVSGLGNRIQALLTGILYARLSGRQLLVDWSDAYYSSAGVNVFPLYFQCPVYDPRAEIPDTDSVNPSVWRGRLHEAAADLRAQYRGPARSRDLWQEFSIDLRRLDYDEELAVMWLYTERIDVLRDHFTGAFAALAKIDNPTILRQLFRENLALHPRLEERVARFERAAFRRPTVGVHVRYTDHRARLGALLWLLNGLLRRAPGLQIFLATDNRQIERLFETSYPSVITTPHWYPPTAGRPLHTRGQRPDPIERGAEALIDLYLLAACDYLIVDPGSSFGQLALLLSEAPAANVFRVRSRGKPSATMRRWSYHFWLRTGLFDWGLGGLAGVWRQTTRHLGRSGPAEPTPGGIEGAQSGERPDGDRGRVGRT
jgi:hypothetical protein